MSSRSSARQARQEGEGKRESASEVGRSEGTLKAWTNEGSTAGPRAQQKEKEREIASHRSGIHCHRDSKCRR